MFTSLKIAMHSHSIDYRSIIAKHRHPSDMTVWLQKLGMGPPVDEPPRGGGLGGGLGEGLGGDGLGGSGLGGEGGSMGVAVLITRVSETACTVIKRKYRFQK